VTWYDVAAAKRHPRLPGSGFLRVLGAIPEKKAAELRKKMLDAARDAGPVDPREIPRLVGIVHDGMRRWPWPSGAVGRLVAAGIPADRARALSRAIGFAIDLGRMARGLEAFRNGRPAEQPPADPLLAEAFRVGQTAPAPASAATCVLLLLVAQTVGVVLFGYWLGRLLGWWGQ
jgi:hypothetical protein